MKKITQINRAKKLTGSEALKESLIYAKFGSCIGIKKCSELSIT